IVPGRPEALQRMAAVAGGVRIAGLPHLGEVGVDVAVRAVGEDHALEHRLLPGERSVAALAGHRGVRAAEGVARLLVEGALVRSPLEHQPSLDAVAALAVLAESVLVRVLVADGALVADDRLEA